MSDQTPRILLIGYGNPGRQDDGLGPALAAAFEKLAIPGVTVDSDYQLTVEDAHAVAQHDVAVFADAALQGPEPFSFTRIEPGEEESFSTHSIRPTGVLGIARRLFASQTPAFMLGIRGYEFEMFEEKLTDKAAANLAKAIGFLENVVRENAFEQALT